MNQLLFVLSVVVGATRKAKARGKIARRVGCLEKIFND